MWMESFIACAFFFFLHRYAYYMAAFLSFKEYFQAEVLLQMSKVSTKYKWVNIWCSTWNNSTMGSVRSGHWFWSLQSPQKWSTTIGATEYYVSASEFLVDFLHTFQINLLKLLLLIMNETRTVKCSIQSWNLWLMTCLKVIFVLHQEPMVLHVLFCWATVRNTEKGSYLWEGVILEHGHIALAERAELYCCIVMHDLL